MAKILHLTRVPDTKLLAFFKDITDQASPERATFQAMDAINFAHSEDCAPHPDFARLFTTTTYLIDQANYHCAPAGLTVIFRRGFQYAVDRSGNATWLRDRPFIDAIEVSGPSEANGPRALRVAQAIKRHLEMAPPLAFDDSGETVMQQSAAILNQVSAAAAEIAAHTAERHRELDALRMELENRANASVDATRASLKVEHDELVASLEKRQRELNARAADLDDRENTHVRRQVKTELVGEVDRLLSATLLEKSQRSFSVVMGVSAIAGAVLLVAALTSSLLLVGVTDQNAIIFAEVTRVLLGIGAATALWFAIRQSALRYRQVSAWENELHRFRLDTERASFLIEGDLEARKLGGSGLPDVMLDRLSRGLFNADRETENPDPVGNTLMHLLNRPAGLEIGTNGVKVNVDKASLRKAGKEIENEV